MMNPLEPVLAVAIAFVVVATAVLAPPPTPKPKPEPPVTSQQTPVEKALADCAKHPDQMCFVQAEPLPADVSEKQKLDQIQKDLDATTRDVVAIKNAIRLQQAVKSLPNESGGPQ